MHDSVHHSLLPPSLRSGGQLYVALPLQQTRDKVREYLVHGGLTFTEPGPSVLVIQLGPGVLQQLSVDLPAVLSQPEIDDAVALLTAAGVVPTPVEFARLRPLKTQLARARADWLITVLESGRITTYFQPIVRSTDPGRVFAYECLLRGLSEDGSLLGPDLMFAAAQDLNLSAYLDRAARLVAIRSVVEHKLATPFFVNLDSESIYRSSTSLDDTVSAMQEAQLAPQLGVIELGVTAPIGDTASLLRTLDSYRALGFRVALDDLGSGYSSLNLLSQLKPDFVKLDKQLIRDVDQDRYRGEIVSRLLEMARSLGVGSVAEGVEREGEWRWVAAHGADYAQGHFLARPAAVPPLPRVP